MNNCYAIEWKYLINILIYVAIVLCESEDCLNRKMTEDNLKTLIKSIIPNLEGTEKGTSGKIGIIGGSVEYTGAPYFSAIAALRVGADLVYIITTESAAPVIKSYSPDLIVYPFLSTKHASKIKSLLKKMDTIVIGPGLGREDETIKLVYEILDLCKTLQKPIVIDADGLYAITKNLTIIKDYPCPGAILTPNHKESTKLIEAITSNDCSWSDYWGEYVTVLVKGKEDQYLSQSLNLKWTITKGGSVRRAGGQGDILSGSLATFFNWAIKTPICNGEPLPKHAQSIATYAAALFTRECNAKAFETYGRNMIASDMLKEIPVVFDDLFM